MIVAGNPRQLESIMRGLLKKQRKRPEDAIQTALVKHIQKRAMPGLVWWRVPNDSKLGGRRTKSGVPFEAIRNKKLGLRKGVSDLHFLYRGRFYALELKAPGNPPTVEQMQFISDVNAAHGHACIAHGLDRAIRCLEVWDLIRPDASSGIPTHAIATVRA